MRYTHNRRTHVRSLVGIASILGTALGVLSAACNDDGSPVASDAPDAAVDAPSANLPDAGHTPEADAPPDPRGPYNPADVPVACVASPCATQIVAGSDHFCARLADGTVRCWGDNTYGVLGKWPGEEGDNGGSTVHAIPDLQEVTSLSAAGGTTCALLRDGAPRCWGDNRRAQLGLERDYPAADESPHPTPSPVALPKGASATRIDVGQGVVCAPLASGELWCWGRDHQGQLVRDDGAELYSELVRSPGPAAIEPLSFARIAPSTHSMLGLTKDGSVWSWGALAGELGTVSGRVGSISPSLAPKRLESLSNVTSLVSSVWIDPEANTISKPGPGEPPVKRPPQAHACALAGGEVHCWGRSYEGALCTGFRDAEQQPAPAPLPSSARAWPQQLAVANEITCARMTDGSVYCCGSDKRGRLGTGAVGFNSASFTKAEAFKGNAVQVATSDRAVCALLVDGSVECWGSNEKGELGRTPDEADHASPAKVAF